MSAVSGDDSSKTSCFYSQSNTYCAYCKLYILGDTFFGWLNEPGVLGKRYTIGNQPGVVGQYLLIQLNSTVLSTLTFAEVEVKAGKCTK